MIRKILTSSRKAGFFITLVLLGCFSINAIHPRHTHADDLPVVHKSGSLSGSETWSAGNVYVIDDAVGIDADVILTIEAGTTVKLSNSGSAHGIFVFQGGSVNVTGTASSPVTITSLQDDSVGGDSGGDGSTVGSPGDYPSAFRLIGGTANISYATIRYADTGVSLDCENDAHAGSLQLADSILNSKVSLRKCPANSASISRNQFEILDQSEAVNIDSTVPTGIILSGSNKNTFVGSGKNIAIYISGAIIPAGSTWEVSSSGGAVIAIWTYLEVDGTLNIDPSAIIKQDSSNYGIYVSSSGTLNANGTGSSQVIFSSLRDDSVGGDSAGDGPTSGGAGDYSKAIYVANGTVHISHTLIQYADVGLSANCASNPGNIDVEDSLLKSEVSLVGCGGGVATLKRNSFAVSGADKAILVQGGSPVGLTLAGADKNTFAGTDQDIAVYLDGTQVSSGSTWNVSGAGGAVIVVPTYIEVDGTLNVDPGTTFKLDSGQYSGISVYGSGSLSVSGTTASPVIFTSMNDNSHGGNTRGYGTTSGAPGDYRSAVAINPGTNVAISNAEFLYADTAVTMSGGNANFAGVEIRDVHVGLNVTDGKVAFRGNFQNTTNKAIQACNWGGSCGVDAAYVNWGSASGPFLAAGNIACGQVTVSPWSTDSGTASANVFAVKNCDGSNNPGDQLNSNASSFYQHISGKQIDCGNGFQDACDAINTAFACLGSAVQLAASQSPIPVSFTNPTDVLDTVSGDAADTADTFLQGVESESTASFTTSLSTGILHVLGLFNSLSSAYNSCAP